MQLTLILILVLTLFSLVGCGATPDVKSFVGPSGEQVNTVRCIKDTVSCFQKASEVCNQKSYKVIDSYRNAGGLYADILPGPVTWYTMSMICGKSDGHIPTFPLRGAGAKHTTCNKVGNSLNCSTY